MIRTKQFYGKDSSDKNSRTGYHWTISWSPEEHVDYYTALEIVREFCEKQLKDYECVYSVHTDQAHTHCHIVFNSVNFNDGKSLDMRMEIGQRYFSLNLTSCAKPEDFIH